MPLHMLTLAMDPATRLVKCQASLACFCDAAVQANLSLDAVRLSGLLSAWQELLCAAQV